MDRTFAQKVAVVTEEMAPYNFVDERDESITGLSTDLVQEIFKRANVEHQFKVYPWAAMMSGKTIQVGGHEKVGRLGLTNW